MTRNSKPVPKPVYERATGAALLLALAAGLWIGVPAAHAQGGDAAIVEAREALRKKDRTRLAAAGATALAERHPLAQWADYFELSNRIADAQQDEVRCRSPHFRCSRFVQVTEEHGQ